MCQKFATCGMQHNCYVPSCCNCSCRTSCESKVNKAALALQLHCHSNVMKDLMFIPQHANIVKGNLHDLIKPGLN
jgi:hypothetical protein